MSIYFMFAYACVCVASMQCPVSRAAGAELQGQRRCESPSSL